MELVKVPTPSKRNLGAERQTENDLTHNSSHSGGLRERGGSLCSPVTENIGLGSPHNALHTHKRPPILTHWSREKIWKEGMKEGGGNEMRHRR